MSTPGKTPGGSKKRSPPRGQGEKPSKLAEKYFGSEVDLKTGVTVNPPQKLTEDEKLPAPAELPDKKPSKDATQEESLKELAEKLHNLGNTTTMPVRVCNWTELSCYVNYYTHL